jgi:hypothetical protein
MEKSDRRVFLGQMSIAKMREMNEMWVWSAGEKTLTEKTQALAADPVPIPL